MGPLGFKEPLQGLTELREGGMEICCIVKGVCKTIVNQGRRETTELLAL